MACAAAAVHKKKPQSRLLALLALSWACLQTAQPVRALAGPTVRAALFDPRTPAFWLSRCSSRPSPSTSSSISTGPHRQLRPLRVSPRRAVQAEEPSEQGEGGDDEDQEQAASAQTTDLVEDAPKGEQLQKTALENEDLAAARRLQTLAIDELETAQKAVVTAQKAVDALQAVWLQREDGDNNEEAKQAYAKFKEAKDEVGKAKLEVEKAEAKVEKATEAVKASFQAGPEQASSGLHWKHDEDATKFANELRTVSSLTNNSVGIDLDLAKNVSMEIYPLTRSLNPDDKSKPFLFVRKQTRVVWNMAVNKSRVAVIGSPGIGKSFSIFYFLRLLMQENQTFVFEARKWARVYLFQRDSKAYTVSSMGLEHWVISDCEELQVSQNHYVIDPDRAERGTVVSVCANTIIAPSPDVNHLGEFKKTPGLVKLYMAPLTLEETMVYASYFGIDQQRATRLFQDFGGVLRKVMAAEAEVKDLRKERESVVGDKGLVKTFFNSGGVLHHSNAAKPLSQVFLIVPSEEDPTDYHVEFAGSGSENALVNKFETELKTLLKPLQQGSQLLDDIFESFAHNILSSGGDSFHIRMLGSRAPVFSATLKPSHRQKVHGGLLELLNTAASQPNTYCTARKNTAVIDGCFVNGTTLHAFQITRGKSHSFKSDKMNDALANMSNPPTKIKLYWVVLVENFFDFSRKAMAGTIPGITIEETVLSLSDPRNPLSKENLERRLNELPSEEAKLRGGLTRRLQGWQSKPRLDSINTEDELAKAGALVTFEESHVKDLCKKLGINPSAEWLAQAVGKWTELLKALEL